eukprot:gene28230-31331_t
MEDWKCGVWPFSETSAPQSQGRGLAPPQSGNMQMPPPGHPGMPPGPMGAPRPPIQQMQGLSRGLGHPQDQPPPPSFFPLLRSRTFQKSMLFGTNPHVAPFGGGPPGMGGPPRLPGPPGMGGQMPMMGGPMAPPSSSTPISMGPMSAHAGGMPKTPTDWTDVIGLQDDWPAMSGPPGMGMMPPPGHPGMMPPPRGPPNKVPPGPPEYASRARPLGITVVDLGEMGPVRCGRCRAYVNPYMRFSSSGPRNFTM